VRRGRRDAIATLVALSLVLALATCSNPMSDTLLPAGQSGGVAKVIAGHNCLTPDATEWLDESVVAADGSTPEAPDAPPSGAIPLGFQPVSAYLCAAETTIKDDDGIWNVISIDQYSGDLKRLVTALALPDDDSADSGASNNTTVFVCTDGPQFVSPLWLVDASGAAVRVRWPLDRCGQAKPDGAIALDALEIVASEAVHRRLLIPQAALDAGCPGEALAPYPPDALVQLNVSDVAGAAIVAPSLLQDASAVAWCRFTLDEPEPDSDQEAEGEYPGIAIGSGTFAAEGTLWGTDASRVVAATIPPLSLGACSAGSTDFVTLADAASLEYFGSRETVWLEGCVTDVPSTGPALALPSYLTRLFD